MTISDFGTTRAGDVVHKITLRSDALTVSILTLGAILQGVRLANVPHNLTLGSDELAAYDGGPLAYFGALIGPVANRISGAQAKLNGTTLQFEPNFLNQHVLHGGSTGFHQKIWSIDDSTETTARLSLEAPHGEGGFPGNRQIQARFTVSANTLTMELEAHTDQSTLMNLANHSYWNLDGSTNFEGHKLQVFADHYLPISDAVMPTGIIAPVENTCFDFRTLTAYSPGAGGGLDHNFCTAKNRRNLTSVAVLTGQSGLSMEMSTTEPGLQVYDAREQSSAPYSGHHGAPYENYAGLALEAQLWPNAPNEPSFPSSEIGPDAPYRQTTRWHFSR